MPATDPAETPELFDGPSQWREAAIDALGLFGEDRCAGASTSSTMPRLIEEFARRLEQTPIGPALDVGGGLGPVSAWLTRRTGHGFVSIDASPAGCAGARRLFGVPAVVAESPALPIAARSCSGTLLNGIVSLLDDLGPTVVEAARVTRPGGLLAIADLTATGDQRVATDTNTFWTADDLEAALAGVGCEIVDLACSDPGIGRWGPVQTMVRDEIADRNRGRTGFDEWWRDGRTISSLVDAGRIAGTAVIARTGRTFA